MRRALIVLAAVAVGLVALYAAAGYWLAPRWLGDALVDAAARSGLELRIGALRTQPFSLEVEASELVLARRDGQELARADRATVDLLWASLWRREWTVERAGVSNPVIQLRLGDQGVAGWPAGDDTPAKSGETPRLRVQRFSVDGGSVRIADATRQDAGEATLTALALEVNDFSTHSDKRASYRVSARAGEGGSLSSEGTFAISGPAAEGRLTLEDVEAAPFWRLAMPGEAVRGKLRGSAAYAYAQGRVTLRDVVAEARDAAYADVELAGVAIRMPELGLPLEAPVALSAQARLADGGEARADGTVTIAPPAADLKVAVQDLPVARAQRWLPEGLAVRVTSGLLGGEGRLVVGNEPDTPRATYEGALSLRDFRLDEADSGNLLVGWSLLETKEATLQHAPNRVGIGEVIARGLRGRLIIDQNGNANVVKAFNPAGAPDRENGPPFQYEVRRVTLEQGVLEFADRSLETPFQATVQDLAGAVTGITTAQGKPARVSLKGRVEEYGAASIVGTLDLQNPRELANIRASFRNLDFVGFTPYTVKFAGYRVRSGRLAADLSYLVRDGALKGQNEVVIERLQLGERVDSPTALDLPVDLAIALLTDSQGRINLRIPVSGSLDDPDFDLAALIARAIGATLRRIVTAPFRAIAGLLGGRDEEGLDRVRFAPGRAELPPPEREQVSHVARALHERPALEVIVRGGYHRERDGGALAREAARRAIAQRAGFSGEGPLDLRDPKVIEAAERLWLERIGNRLELEALRESEKRYGSVLLEQLAAREAIEPAALEALAGRRAEAVAAVLVERGVDRARVVLEAPVAVEEAEKEGVPTALTLGPRRTTSAAGASAPPAIAARPPSADVKPVTATPDLAADIVRKAQRRLNAAGFDAGPVDGIAGPRTESGVKRFQQALGIAASGALDRETLAALGLAPVSRNRE